MIYKCLECEFYMKCPVNAGKMCDFVKDAKVTYLEDHDRNHILVYQCEKFKQRDVERGPELPLPVDVQVTRECAVCGRLFIVTNENRTVSSDTKCKEMSRKYRKSRKRS